MSYSFNSFHSKIEKLLVKETIEEYKEFHNGKKKETVSYGNCFRLIKQHREIIIIIASYKRLNKLKQKKKNTQFYTKSNSTVIRETFIVFLRFLQDWNSSLFL